MSRVKEVEVGTPVSNEGGSGNLPPLDGGNGSKPTSPTGSKAD
jgi:hypothetical protein